MNGLKGLFLFLICIFLSCGKTELPTPIVGEPIFFFDGQLGGVAKKINAGDNDFYLFTEFSKDDDSVFSFTGRLAKLEQNCPDTCAEQLVISIRDFEQNISNVVSNINA